MKRLSILFLVILLVACQSNQKAQLSTLKDSVMAVHDEVMPKMGALMITSKSLLAMADSLSESDSIKVMKCRLAAENIDKANESMMVWMRNYEPDFKGDDAAIIEYLNQQKESIGLVKIQMETALAEGKKILEAETP